MKKILSLAALSLAGLFFILYFFMMGWPWLVKEEINQPFARSPAKSDSLQELFRAFPENYLTVKTIALGGGVFYRLQKVQFFGHYGSNWGWLNAQWWERKNSDHSRVAVVLPIAGGGDPSGIIAWYLLHAHGFDVLQFSREQQKELLDSNALAGCKSLIEVYAEAVNSVYAMKLRLVNYALAVDWLKKEQHYQQVVLIGLSLGAIEGSILALDPDIKAAALVIGGGNMAEIIMTSQEPFVYQWREILKDKLAEFSEVTPSVEETQRRLSIIFEKTEPLDFVSALDPGKILMINGKHDQTIPLRNSLKLWLAANQPRIIWLPATHIDLAWYAPYVLYRVGSFLEEKISPK